MNHITIKCSSKMNDVYKVHFDKTTIIIRRNDKVVQEFKDVEQPLFIIDFQGLPFSSFKFFFDGMTCIKYIKVKNMCAEKVIHGYQTHAPIQIEYIGCKIKRFRNTFYMSTVLGGNFLTFVSCELIAIEFSRNIQFKVMKIYNSHIHSINIHCEDVRCIKSLVNTLINDNRHSRYTIETTMIRNSTMYPVLNIMKVYRQYESIDNHIGNMKVGTPLVDYFIKHII